MDAHSATACVFFREERCSVWPQPKSVPRERCHEIEFYHLIYVKTTHYTTFDIQLEDTGRYNCLANSPAGDDDKEFLVRVHGE